MAPRVRLRSQLPPNPSEVIQFPAEWAVAGETGTLVEFETDAGCWIGNFEAGYWELGLECAALHPNGHDAVVIASGDLWEVDLMQRSAARLSPCIDASFRVEDPAGWVFSVQGLALLRLGPEGLVWHTRRLSGDALDDVRLVDDQVLGRASGDIGEWIAFQVDLHSGRSMGGSCGEEDVEGWEQLADSPE